MRLPDASFFSGRQMAWLGALALAAACGGNVDVNDGSGGSGGGTTTGTTTGMTSTGMTTGTTTTTTTGAGGSGGSSCDGLGQVDCLGAYPSCAPVYDDACCPSCDPMGGCADCIDLQYHGCAPFDEACGANPSLPCGLVPGWACAGGQATCGDPGGSPSLCGTVAGCIPGYCPVNIVCDTDPVCTPVTAGTCSTQCDSVPPPCPDGTVAESDGFCYTGLCVPAQLCGG